MIPVNELIGTHDLLFVTLDTLRYDVARDALARGETPNLAAVLPGGAWEARHSPGSFTYAAHHAFFAGFLPAPIRPGRHPRLFAARFAGSESTTAQTCVFDAPEIVSGLAGRGYHTVCIGGVGFFNKQSPLGCVLPGLFAESHWSPDVPFCEMRCGFCNPFTTANPKDDLVAAYLEALARQARRVREALGPASIARLAIGGGTPTYLAPAALHSLFDLAERLFGADLDGIPISVETSPRTAEVEKLRALRERGVDRISIGIQSFVAAEVAAVGRAQQTAIVERALDRIREAGFPTLNIDLMYGLPGQTVASWLQSLQAALRYAPEELYLYPLYVRPLTGLERRSEAWDDIRLACYREGRGLLLDLGYEQVSMRMFRRRQRLALGARRSAGTQAGRLAVWSTIGPSAERRAPSAARRNDEHGPVYCCQEDGMVGLGCGARSYTRGLHYATEYAVGAPGVKAILAEYVARPAEAFDAAEYGCVLDGEEQRRRYVIQSLLQVEGLCLDAYRRRFGTDLWGDLPELEALPQHGLAGRGGGRLRLTEAGLERSDAIGPWLYSDRVRECMGEYALR